MGDAEVKGAQDQRPAVGEIVGCTKVVPEAEREQGSLRPLRPQRR